MSHDTLVDFVPAVMALKGREEQDEIDSHDLTPKMPQNYALSHRTNSRDSSTKGSAGFLDDLFSRSSNHSRGYDGSMSAQSSVLGDVQSLSGSVISSASSRQKSHPWGSWGGSWGEGGAGDSTTEEGNQNPRASQSSLLGPKSVASSSSLSTRNPLQLSMPHVQGRTQLSSNMRQGPSDSFNFTTRSGQEVKHSLARPRSPHRQQEQPKSSASYVVGSIFYGLSNNIEEETEEKKYYRAHSSDDGMSDATAKSSGTFMSLFRLQEEQLDDNFEQVKLKQGIETARKTNKTKHKTAYEVDAPRARIQSSRKVVKSASKVVRSSSDWRTGKVSKVSNDERFGDSDSSASSDSLDNLLYPEPATESIDEDRHRPKHESVASLDSSLPIDYHEAQFEQIESSQMIRLEAEEQLEDIDHAEAVLNTFTEVLEREEQARIEFDLAMQESLPSLCSIGSDKADDLNDPAMTAYLVAVMTDVDNELKDTSKPTLTTLFKWSEKLNVDRVERSKFRLKDKKESKEEKRVSSKADCLFQMISDKEALENGKSNTTRLGDNVQDSGDVGSEPDSRKNSQDDVNVFARFKARGDRRRTSLNTTIKCNIDNDQIINGEKSGFEATSKTSSFALSHPVPDTWATVRNPKESAAIDHQNVAGGTELVGKEIFSDDRKAAAIAVASRLYPEKTAGKNGKEKNLMAQTGPIDNIDRDGHSPLKVEKSHPNPSLAVSSAKDSRSINDGGKLNEKTIVCLNGTVPGQTHTREARQRNRDGEGLHRTLKSSSKNSPINRSTQKVKADLRATLKSNSSSFRRADIEIRGTEQLRYKPVKEEMSLSISPDEVLAALMGASKGSESGSKALVESKMSSISRSASSERSHSQKKSKKSERDRKSSENGTGKTDCSRSSRSKLSTSTRKSSSRRSGQPVSLDEHGSLRSSKPTSSKRSEGRSRSESGKEVKKMRSFTSSLETKSKTDTQNMHLSSRKLSTSSISKMGETRATVAANAIETKRVNSSSKSNSQHLISKGTSTRGSHLKPDVNILNAGGSLESSSLNKLDYVLHDQSPSDPGRAASYHTGENSIQTNSVVDHSKILQPDKSRERRGHSSTSCSMLEGNSGRSSGRSRRRRENKSKHPDPLTDDDSIEMPKPVFRKAPSRRSHASTSTATSGRSRRQQGKGLRENSISKRASSSNRSQK